MRPKLKLLLFICCFMNCNVYSQIIWATKSGKECHIDFYNDIGIGYGKHAAIFTEQFNISVDDFVIGFFGQFGSRDYVGRRYPSPNVTMHQYRFMNEYAILFGKQFHPSDQNMFVLSIGPVYRWYKYREWPDKGSGGIPLVGALMYRTPSYDTKYYGFRINAEISHQGVSSHAGIGLCGYFSYTKDGPGFGATLNFLFGAIR